MIYLLINESRKQMINIWLSNWQTLESQKQSQKQNESGVSLVTLLSGNKKSETFGEKNRYKSGEFELVFFSEAKKMKPQEADACLLDGGVSWTSPEKSAG